MWLRYRNDGPGTYKPESNCLLSTRYKRANRVPECETMRVVTWATIAGLLIAAVAIGQDSDAPTPTMSVNDLMIITIAPATDTIWGIDDPQTEEDWQVFIDAADAVIDAGQTLRVGGTGPNDAEWASDPEWQAFVDTLVGAGQVARKAAIEKDVEQMYTAGEVIYPPCEECHNQFHPGVTGQ